MPSSGLNWNKNPLPDIESSLTHILTEPAPAVDAPPIKAWARLPEPSNLSLVPSKSKLLLSEKTATASWS